MKILFLAFVFLIITISAKAENVKGTVKLFTGYTVETHHIFSYYALETEDKDRILLPIWIDAKALSKIPGHEVALEGKFEEIICSDMSRACPTAEIKKVDWFQYQNPSAISSEIVYTGIIKKFTNFVALHAGQDIVEIPAFLYAEKLLELNPQVTLMGKAETLDCEIETCGPQRLKTFSLLKLDFQ